MALWSYLTELPSRFISHFYLKNSRILECRSPANTNQAPVFNYFAATPSSSACTCLACGLPAVFPLGINAAPTTASLMKRPPQCIQPSRNRRQTPTAQRQRLHIIRRVLRNALHRLQAPDKLPRHRSFNAEPFKQIDFRRGRGVFEKQWRA